MNDRLSQEEINAYPAITLPGSENWRDAYNWSIELEKQFPDVDAYDFAQAVQLAGYEPGEDRKIEKIIMLQQGCNDGPHWVWAVYFERKEDAWYGPDNDLWILNGWCDYTGWDCRAGADWTQF